MRARDDVIRAVEASYAVHRPEPTWLEEICREVRPWKDLGLGIIAWTFSIHPGDTWIGEPCVVGGNPDFAALPKHFMKEFGTDTTREAYLSGPCCTGSETYGQQAFAKLCPPGVSDFLATLGVSPEGLGVMLGAPTSKSIEVDRRVRFRSERLAAHLANTYRLRIRIHQGLLNGTTPADADAVLEPDGKLVHAATAQTKDSETTERLRTAVKAIDRARGAQRRVEPEAALDSWRALVSGRWSLVDHFESDGRRYMVALDNPPGTTDPRQLTPRERHVAAYAALGYSGKQTAYTLGIDPSVVSRHLAEAVRKLGLASPLELPAYFARLVRRGMETP